MSRGNECIIKYTEGINKMLKKASEHTIDGIKAEKIGIIIDPIAAESLNTKDIPRSNVTIDNEKELPPNPFL